ATEAEFIRTAPGQVFAHLAQMREAWPHPVAEHRSDRVPGESVALAHIAGADKPDPQSAHARVPTSDAPGVYALPDRARERGSRAPVPYWYSAAFSLVTSTVPVSTHSSMVLPALRSA